ncbi:MAG: SixA phosphatase family protein, partial [Actinokineospora sp.]
MILFRHGPAGHRDPARWPDDAGRPVTKRGVERTARAAAGLKRVVGRVSRVATSPLVRAHQTADIVGNAMASGVHVETVDALAPGAPLRDTMRWLRGLESGASVVLV